MDVWSILGIEYTTDLKIIREAYANKAKEVHPEEHPEEFTELRNAYKQALKIAKDDRNDEVYSCTKSFARPLEFDTEIAEDKPVVERKDVFDYGSVIYDEKELEEQMNQFFEKFNIIYEFSVTRNNVKAWAVIMDNIMYSELFTIPMFLNVLAQKIGMMEYINKEVYAYMIEIYKRYYYVPGAEEFIQELTWAMEDAHVNHIDRITDYERVILQKITGKYSENADFLEGYNMNFIVTRLFKVYNELDGSKESAKKFMEEYNAERYEEQRRQEQERTMSSPVRIFCIIVAIICMIVSCVNGGYRNSNYPQQQQETTFYYNQDTGRFEIKYK